MRTDFLNFVQKENLFKTTDRVLLAVSGGIDSVAMADLFAGAFIDCAIAHCNFALRGKDSDEDALFVEKLAQKYALPFFVKRFDTIGFAKKKGISLQMAARELRYNWFEELRTAHGFDYVAVAHHKDDVVETFHINLSRGTGLKGLTGIRPKNGHIVRPLLYSNRSRIVEFCRRNNLSFREDSSNNHKKYARSLIRHHVLPNLEQAFPNYSLTILKNIDRFSEIEQIFNNAIEQKKQELAIRKDGLFMLEIEKLRLLNPLRTYLFEFLYEFNFQKEIVEDIIEGLDAKPGNQYFSTTHRLVKDRDFLIVGPKPKAAPRALNLHEGQDELILDDGKGGALRLRCQAVDWIPGHLPPSSPAAAYFDHDKIDFPLSFRHWRKGDFFMPMGMKNNKKLSDFFIDNKFSLVKKERTWLMLSGEQVVWLVAHRIDERYKITEQTRKVLIVNVESLDTQKQD